MTMETSTVIETARLLVQEWAKEMTMPEPNRLDVVLKRADDLVPAVAGLRVKRLGYLAAITGLDLGPEVGGLEVLYHFCTGPVVITLRVRLLREEGRASVPTLSDIIPSAQSFEQELSEMLGVTVVGLLKPGYLYLPDDWPEGVYPLRKDFDRHILSSQVSKERVHANETES
jgi:Ni,Fe-hydrogenase III component G